MAGDRRKERLFQRKGRSYTGASGCSTDARPCCNGAVEVFCFHCSVATGRSEEDNERITESALERVKDAIAHHDKTITLSVGQLTTGVTIPEWTAYLDIPRHY